MNNSRFGGTRWIAAVAPLVLSSLACSPSTGSGAKPDPAGVGGVPSSNGGGPPGSGAAAGSEGMPPDLISQGRGGAYGLDDGGCFATASKAEQVEIPVETTVTTYGPFDMFIMYDQSGSMDGDTPAGTKWDAIKAALTAFVNDPASDGIGVGIGYFPFVNPNAPGVCFTNNDCGAFGPCVPVLFIGYCQGADACQRTQYATPDVPIEVLPAVAPKIVASVNNHSPGGGTPTRPALEGATDYAIPWDQNNGNKRTVILLATDGDPTGCPPNGVPDVASIAAAALTRGVSTFVVGVGSSLTSLNEIAAAGGTNQALIVDTASGDPTQQFRDAMNAIREQVTTTTTTTVIQSTPVPCEWTIPATPPGLRFDKSKVNVEFASGGGAPSGIGAVASAAECPNFTNGWHYDNAADPTKVLVCPQTCQMIQAATAAQVNVVFGCETKQAIE